MPKAVFEELVCGVVSECEYFRYGLLPNCTGKFGIAPLVKSTAAPRQISYGTCADAMDEYCKLLETFALLSLINFEKAVVLRFASRFLRRPTLNDLKHIERHFAALGFPGCMGIVDCASWEWVKLSKALQSVYIGRKIICIPNYVLKLFVIWTCGFVVCARECPANWMI